MQLLRNLRVLDLSHTLAGPFATMILSDLGAEIIKVESPIGDETRTWAPHIDDESAYFMSINRGKKSIVINLKHHEGREILYKLVRECDVVVENFRPGVPEKLGVDYNTLLKYNPRIVYCSIKGFKTNSVYSNKPAYDIILQALSGLMMATGEEGRPPIRVSFALFDVFTAMMAVINILTALYTNTRPCYIELPMYDVSVFSMCYIPMIYLLTGRKPKRMGSAHPSIVPYQAFRDCNGKYFIVAAANDRLWQALCKALGLEHLANDPRFKTNKDRVKNRNLLIPLLEEVFKKKPREYWIKILEEAGVPTAPVYELDEVFNDVYIKNSGIIVELSHSKLGKVKQLAEPMLINDTRPCSNLPPPMLGEHTVEILRDLGYSEKDIRRMKEEGIVYYP